MSGSTTPSSTPALAPTPSRTRQRALPVPSLPLLAPGAPPFVLAQLLALPRAAYVNCTVGAEARLADLVACAPPAAGSGSHAATTELLSDGDGDDDDADGVARALSAALGGERMVFLSYNVSVALPPLARDDVRKALVEWVVEMAAELDAAQL